ncbi:MAG: hypothetical protein AB8B97_25300 [Granulosicoccus sp.]
MNDEAQAHYYKRKDNTAVTAVQLNLDTEGFTFVKWGGEQRCRPGDWLINRAGNCYSIADGSFRRTYREVSTGRYVKHTLVRARIANSAGTIATQEGGTAYEAGDYLIENADDGSDNYAIGKDRFHELYELVDKPEPA